MKCIKKDDHTLRFPCRFIWALMEDAAVVIKCRMSHLYSHRQGRLFAQLVDLLRFYEGFEIDEQTGTQLTDDDVLLAHSSRLQAFQLLVYKQVPKVWLQKGVDVVCEVWGLMIDIRS